MIKEAVRRSNHDIFPHLGLPETLAELQAECRSEIAALLGKEAYDYLKEPVGQVKSISFAGGYQMGQTRTVHQGDRILVQAAVEYEGAAPTGVLVHTNLNGSDSEILMRRVAPDIFQAEVEATRQGDNFWLTVSTTLRRYDHPLRRMWIGGDVHFVVKAISPASPATREKHPTCE